MMILLALTACGKVLDGPSDAQGDGPRPDTRPPGPAVDCEAQRVVHLVGGTGGLAWFTLAWPAPAVITGYQPAYAYDDPDNAREVTSEAAHPLFARRIGARTIWEGLGQSPQPTAFVAGTNQTHTQQPTTNLINGNTGLAAAGAALQSSLAPTVAALQFSPGGPYGQAPGAPALTSVADVEGAIGIFQGMISPQVEAQLRPSAAQLARYVPPGAVQAESALAARLAFTANAFRLGLLGTVMIQAFSDDPHGAFTNGPPTQRANNLASMLDAFYGDLAGGNEASCGRGGDFLSLADNVVMIVTGDTPKNSFVNQGWPDGTPGGANFMYVRSNGFLRPGWFGRILPPSTRTNWNPTTGELDPNAADVAASTSAAFAGALYAIARGDKAKVQAIINVPFDGVIKP